MTKKAGNGVLKIGDPLSVKTNNAARNARSLIRYLGEHVGFGLVLTNWVFVYISL